MARTLDKQYALNIINLKICTYNDMMHELNSVSTKDLGMTKTGSFKWTT